jgi:hypothetical protein
LRRLHRCAGGSTNFVLVPDHIAAKQGSYAQEHTGTTAVFLPPWPKEDNMADSNGSGVNALLGLILGAMAVFVVMAFAFGWMESGTKTAVKFDPPRVDAPISR